jgi:MFS family permease
LALAVPIGTAGVCYLGVSGLLLMAGGTKGASRVEGPPSRARGLRQLGHDVVDGVKVVARHPQLRAFTVITGVSNVGSEAVVVLLVLYAVAPGPLGLSRWGYGILLSCFAAGGMAGAAVSAAISARVGRSRVLTGSVLLMAIGLAGPSFSSSSLAAGASLLVAGVATAWYNVICVSFRQAVVPSELLGRASASYGLVALGGIPLGAALAGVAAHAIGVRASILVAGAVVLRGMLAIRPLVGLRLSAAEAQAEGAA